LDNHGNGSQKILRKIYGPMQNPDGTWGYNKIYKITETGMGSPCKEWRTQELPEK
jgi:hypothetical protein